jgi:hypothetical protein
MNLAQAVERVQESIPASMLTAVNWGAFSAALGFVFTTIVPAFVGVLSAIWLGCQIWLFFRTKPWRKK